VDFLDPVVDASKRAWWWLGDRVPQSTLDSWERFKLQSQRLGRAVQQVVVTVLLFLLYTIGFGITRVSASVFGRRHLKLYDSPLKEDSYWRDAEGYEPEMEQLLRQY